MPSPHNPSSLPAKPSGVYRVVHTADWHLGKLLDDHSREDEHRHFLTFLLETIQTQSVDALLIAGDIFDSANPPQSAVTLYYNFLSNLFKSSHCTVVIIAGNHDSPAHLEAPGRVLKTLRTHVIGSLTAAPADMLIPLPSKEAPQLIVAAVPFLRDRDLRVGISGQNASEIQKHLVYGIGCRYAEVAEAAIGWHDQGIALLATGHLTVLGSTTSESEREIHVGGLGAISADAFPKEFDYVALGHLHRPQAAGHCETVRYSGSPIPLSFGEANDHKELRVLDFAEGRLSQQAAIPIPRSRCLTQIRTQRDNLEADLKAYEPATTELRAWVEIVVEDPLRGDNLHSLVHSLVADREFDVIRIIPKSKTALPGLTALDPAATEDIERLLSNPSHVFARRLLEEEALSEEEELALKTMFEELKNLYSEQLRAESTTATQGI